MRMWMASLVAVVLLGSARADDVTLKSGVVHTDMTLVQETATTYVFLDAEGRKVTFAKAAVEKIEPKPTVRGTLLERQKELKPKDLDAHVELAKWAKENGLGREGDLLLDKVLRSDRNHVAAHELRGDKLIDGKWMSEKDWKKHEAKADAEKYKARGWKELDDEWLSPVDYHRKKNSLELVDGHWVDPKLGEKIRKGGLKWLEGEWITPEEQAKAADGKRRLEGARWMSIDEIDDLRSMDNPWKIGTDHIDLLTSVKHPLAVRYADMLEQAYGAFSNIVGEEHPDLYGKTGKLLVIIGDRLQVYQALGHGAVRLDRSVARSNKSGAFYSTVVENRGAVCTFHMTGRTERWATATLAHAFFARFRSYGEMDEKALDALGGYAMGWNGKTYDPNLVSAYITDNKSPLKNAESVLRNITYDDNTGYHTIPQAGAVVAYLRHLNEPAFLDWWQRFARKDAPIEDLLDLCAGKERPSFNDDFQAWLKKAMRQ